MEPFITISNAASAETVSSSRYYHDVSKNHGTRVILQWTRKGFGMYEDANGAKAVNEGAAFVIIAPENASYYYPRGITDPWLIDWADFTGPLAISLFGEFKRQFGPVVSLPRKSSAGMLLSRLINAVERGQLRDRRESSRVAYDFLLEWWREAGQRNDESRLLSVVEACTGNGANRLMTVKELAEECGMSREYFTRCFVLQMGTSPAAWLRKRRLEAAAVLLRSEPALTLATIARETGFASGRHLSASFHRAYGITVSTYRQEPSLLP